MTDRLATLRDLLVRLELSQGAAARFLGIREREFRRMCAGTKPIPYGVILALQKLLDLKD